MVPPARSATPSLVTPPSSLAEVVELVVGTLEQELPDSAVWVGHLDRQRAVLRVIASGGETSFGLEPGVEAPLETSFCNVLASGVGAPICNDVALDSAYGSLPAAPGLDVGSFTGAPLRLQDGSAVGTLCAFHHDRGAYSERQLRLLSTFAALLARELEHERRRADLDAVVGELRRQAMTDPLTGVANRRAFSSALNTAYGNALAGRRGFVALADLDAFKPINDAHGHLVGDAVLVSVATALRDAGGPEDLVGRLGGDEFGIVLTSTGPERWLDAARRGLREASRRHGFPIDVSFGVAPLAGAGAPEDALAAADDALYACKRGLTRG